MLQGWSRRPCHYEWVFPASTSWILIDGEVREVFDGSLRTLEGFGWRIEEVSTPNLRYALGAELAILSAEASSYHREMMRVRADEVSSNVRRELDSGMVLLATDYLLGQR